MKIINELVSIIMPAFNCEKYVAESIESVLKQTYTNWEMIIVNDKSSDNTKKIIEMYEKSEPRIKLINLEKNQGAAVARNIALEEAKGQYIAFLDSDDRWKNKKLEKQLNFMKNNKYGFTFTEYEYILDENNNKNKIFRVISELDYHTALKNTIIGCLTVVIDRKIIGDFRMPLVRRGQDNLTWLMLLKKGHKAYGLAEVLGEYRKVKGSLSNNKFKALKRQWNNYRKFEQLKFWKCCYYYFLYIINNIKKYLN